MPSFVLDVDSVYCWVLCVLCAFLYKSFIIYLFWNCFLLVCSLMHFTEQMFMILIQSTFFLLWIVLFCVLSKCSSTNQMLPGFSLVLSSRNFIILHFTFLCENVRLVFLCIDIFLAPSAKKNFFHWISLTLLSKLSWIHLYGFISKLFILFY
jgi:hypothetical protein